MADRDLDRSTRGVLGNIDPDPKATEHRPVSNANVEEAGENDESMIGGSQHDRCSARLQPGDESESI